MTLSIKHDVKFRVGDSHIKPEMCIAAMIVHAVYEEHGIPCVITSALDGAHMPGSRHYYGLALDFRTRDVPDAVLAGVVEELRERLGPQYDVVREADHLHVEFDP